MPTSKRKKKSESNKINGYLPLTVVNWGTIFQVDCVGKLGFLKLTREAHIQWCYNLQVIGVLSNKHTDDVPNQPWKAVPPIYTAYLCRDVKDSIKISFTLYKKSTTTVHYLHNPTPLLDTWMSGASISMSAASLLWASDWLSQQRNLLLAYVRIIEKCNIIPG